MADNEQNTQAGGGEAIIAPSGNGILDGFLKLANVASSTFGKYEDIQDRRAARELELANAAVVPMQSKPASQSNSPVDFLSNPESTQFKIFAGISIVAVAGLSIWLIKKM